MPPKSNTYTAESVDVLLASFEKAASKTNAVKGQTVKLRASERDLLKEAEGSRDLMMMAVKGDKQLLAAVFGGTCERFYRFRNTIDSIELSDMHASDQRWGHIKDAIDMIEEVLKTLGCFKPWTIGSVAPDGVSYTGMKDRYNPGDSLQMFAECNAIDAEYSIDDELPEGLFFNKENGEIKGTMPPGLEIDKEYTVTAGNCKGEANTKFRLCVMAPKPETVSYDHGDVNTGDSVSWEPTVTGGTPKEFTVSPPLPKGLVLDKATGEIYGTPAEAAPSTEYTVTASNGSGNASVPLKFAVKVAAPTSLAYPGAQKEYPLGSVVHLIPSVEPEAAAAGKSTFTIAPDLPAGLVIMSETGVISGSPTAPSDEVTYKVTVKNAGGEASCDLPIAIKHSAPSSLKYPEPPKYYVGETAPPLTPEVEGLITEWTVEPALPAGLFLDPQSGTISGSPEAITPAASYKVTAKNPEGETSVTVDFAVQRPAPMGLTYPALQPEYPVGKAMVMRPRVQGQVDTYSVSPKLPEGLVFATKNGMIMGTPKKAVDETTYTVTAKNETGETTCPLVFSVKLMPPESISFNADDHYCVGEPINLTPEIEGGATKWEVEPALPPGVSLNPENGEISGVPTEVAEAKDYVITASNEAGGTSSVVHFSVDAPPPKDLSFGHGPDYMVGTEVLMEPELGTGVCTEWKVEPALPDGITIDPSTGVISGVPTAETASQTYKITGSNSSGSTSADVTFKVSPGVDPDSGVNQAFAASIEEIMDLAEMPAEPSKQITMADWMVWMVHRAWLNDPTLTDFNFSGMMMPLPYLEPRVAPKLCKALEKNTSIVSLNLAGSNLQKPQGPDMAEALKKNKTLKTLNIESNNLDSDSIKLMIDALTENPESCIETWRMINQKHMGQFFGRPVEEAMNNFLKKNSTIIKLGFVCQDAHWRNEIDKCILKNVDIARRKRKGGDTAEVDQIAAKAKTLAKLVLSNPPEDKAAFDVFEDDNEQLTIARKCIASSKRLPTNQQLQAFFKNEGKALKFAEVAPLVKAFRAKLLDSAKNTKVTVGDTYGTDTEGMFRAWTEKNDRWNLDIWPAPDQRFDYAAAKQPIIEISDEYAEWIKPSA